MQVGFCTILFAIFLTLKLAGVGMVAAWSWWWVTAPLWIPFAIVFGMWALALAAAGIGWLVIISKTGKRR